MLLPRLVFSRPRESEGTVDYSRTGDMSSSDLVWGATMCVSHESCCDYSEAGQSVNFA